MAYQGFTIGSDARADERDRTSDYRAELQRLAGHRYAWSEINDRERERLCCLLAADVAHRDAILTGVHEETLWRDLAEAVLHLDAADVAAGIKGGDTAHLVASTNRLSAMWQCRAQALADLAMDRLEFAVRADYARELER